MVRYTSPDQLLDWAKDLEKFLKLQRNYEGAYQHQCWINEFKALEFRLRMRTWFHQDRDYAEGGERYKEKLQDIIDAGRSIACLSLVIYDSTEKGRYAALEWLDDKPSIREEVLSNITILSRGSIVNDPWGIFPCVATEAFLRRLMPAAQKCTNCTKPFKQGATMRRNYCTQHFKCLACLPSDELFGCNLCIPYPRGDRYGVYKSYKDIRDGLVRE